jgi:trans-aconitate methyltransferase
MDDAQQAQAYSEADFTESHQRFVDEFVARFPHWQSKPFRAIDLGCGPADVTVRFAHAHPQAHVDGVDGAEAMLAFGRRRVHLEGLGDRVRLEQRHLPDDALDTASYDVGISNSVLHHLPDPAVLWHTLSRSTVDGATMLVMDLCRPADDDAVDLMVERYMADAPPVLARDFRASLRAAYQVDEVRQQVAAAGLALDVERITDRHLLAWGAP